MVKTEHNTLEFCPTLHNCQNEWGDGDLNCPNGGCYEELQQSLTATATTLHFPTKEECFSYIRQKNSKFHAALW